MKKIIVGLLLILNILIIGCAKEQVLGGDKDEHGCIGSAGYSWCDAKQKCLRTWEENCSDQTKYYCETDSNCVSTCGEKCVNKDWAKNYTDTCVNVRAWTCTCVDNTCYTDGQAPY